MARSQTHIQSHLYKYLYWFFGVLSALSLLCAPDAQSAAPEGSHLYLSTGLNRTNLTLDSDDFPDFILSDGHEDGAGTALALGYQFGRPYLEAQVSFNNISYTFSSLFGVEKLRYYKLQLTGGYDLALGTSAFSVGPEVSLARISMTLEEGALFNPGEEDEINFSEHGWGAALQTKWKLGSKIKLKFSYGWYQLQSIEQTDGVLTLEVHF